MNHRDGQQKAERKKNNFHALHFRFRKSSVAIFLMDGVPVHRKQYIAGFFDGDGSIGIPTPTPKRPSENVAIAIYQSHDSGVPPELIHVRSHYGGCINKTRVGWEGHRDEWVLALRRRDLLIPMLVDLAANAIVKQYQAARALEYMTSGKQQALGHSQAIKAANASYADIAIDPARITDAYLAGLFAAEGSVETMTVFDCNSKYEYFRSSISQASCLRLLEAIKAKLQIGEIYVGKLVFNRAETPALFARIRPFLVGQKVAQVDAVLNFHPRICQLGEKRDQKDKEDAEKIAKQLKRMKRM